MPRPEMTREQLVAIDENTAKTLMTEIDLPQNIKSYIVQFESGISQEDFDDPRFSYRVAFVKKISNNKNTADKVVQFVPSGSETANALNEVILKETMNIDEFQAKAVLGRCCTQLIFPKTGPCLPSVVGIYGVTQGAIRAVDSNGSGVSDRPHDKTVKSVTSSSWLV